MEPPIVPMSPRRGRLLRDFTIEDEAPPLHQRPPLQNVETLNSPRGKHEMRSSGNRNTQAKSTSRNADFFPGSIGPPPTAQYNDITATSGADKQDEDLRKHDFTLDSVEDDGNLRQRGSFAPSVSSISRISQHTGISGSSGSRLPDFFASEVFQIVLHNPTTAHQLLKFSESRLCGENLQFLDKVDHYRILLNDVAKTMFEIHRDFISQNAPGQINVNQNLLSKVNKDLKTSLAATLPKLESLFVDSQNEIEKLVSADIYPRFVRHQMTMSAAKALAGDRGKYAGLGDCFVLTDPGKADNPIVYASDGFVNVTGYPRNEIIPRNCRFLQNQYTDRTTVKRLREAINRREESVELILNQKRNGEPFWNLLYTTPLYDDRGNVVFFLGGQVNCSTTIHHSSDILRVLSMPSDVSENCSPSAVRPDTLRNSRGKRLLSAFRSNSKPTVPPRAPGMENDLLEKIEKMNLKKQMDTFYTAYSKFIVINFTTFSITFHSAGMVNLLSPPAGGPVPPPFIVGTDIFKFLAVHAYSGSLSRDFRSRVKTALKAGQAVSLDIALCTRRQTGFEKFVVHWTPLKGEVGEVGFVVLTFGGGLD